MKIFSLVQLEKLNLIQLGRGKVISKKNLNDNPGDYPVYSSAKTGNGIFGTWSNYDFDEEMITWSVDGGGDLFYRHKHKFSITNVGGFVKVLDKNIINTKYLYYALKNLHNGINFDWVKKAHPSVLRKEYNYIPVPSLQEQEKIVERLDKVFENIDHKISIYEDEIKGIDNLFNSTIHSIFVQGKDNYSEVFLKDIAEYFNGLTYSPTDKSDSGTVVLRSSNVQNNKLDFKDIVRVSKNVKEKLFVQNGDVLICSRNGSKRLIGKSAEIKDLPEPMTFGTFMMIVRSDKNNYLKWFFKSSVFKQQISSGENTMINQITRYMLDEIKLQLPNEKVQKEIDNKLTKLYKACEDLRQNINLKLYKTALLKKSILNKEFSYE